MLRWARDRRVFYVEEPIFDAITPRLDVQVIASNLHVAVPHLPPGADANEEQRALVDALMTRERVAYPLLWLYTPLAFAWARHLRAGVTVYDCMDELSNFRGADASIASRERELFAAADLVFTGGQSLYEAKREQHPRVYPFPSSVDAAHFRRARSHASDPADQASIPHPRVGYFGVVDERMDLDLLRDLAALRPDVHLVLIGPVAKIDLASVPRAPNLHWLGPKRYEDLPSYLAGWDVAMMPFARNDATRMISPTKTLEYLAAAKPIVSTSIRDVVRPYGEAGVVRIADDARAFAAAIDAARDEAMRGEPATIATREALLASTSWDATFAEMRALVEDVWSRRSRQRERVEDPRCSTT